METQNETPSRVRSPYKSTKDSLKDVQEKIGSTSVNWRRLISLATVIGVGAVAFAKRRNRSGTTSNKSNINKNGRRGRKIADRYRPGH